MLCLRAWQAFSLCILLLWTRQTARARACPRCCGLCWRGMVKTWFMAWHGGYLGFPFGQRVTDSLLMSSSHHVNSKRAGHLTTAAAEDKEQAWARGGGARAQHARMAAPAHGDIPCGRIIVLFLLFRFAFAHRDVTFNFCCLSANQHACIDGGRMGDNALFF